MMPCPKCGCSMENYGAGYICPCAEPVPRLLYSEPMFLQHPGTIDNPEPAPVLTFADIQAGVAKMRDCPTSDDEKSVVLPGRVALQVLSIVEAAETRGVIPGRCKDCSSWHLNMNQANEPWCADNDSWSYPADGSGFCSKFEVKS